MTTTRRVQCHVCRHRERSSIDLGLARGVAASAIAKRYGVGLQGVYRHKNLHLSPALRAKLIQGPDIEGLDLDKLRETES